MCTFDLNSTSYTNFTPNLSKLIKIQAVQTMLQAVQTVPASNVGCSIRRCWAKVVLEMLVCRSRRRLRRTLLHHLPHAPFEPYEGGGLADVVHRSRRIRASGTQDPTNLHWTSHLSWTDRRRAGVTVGRLRRVIERMNEEPDWRKGAYLQNTRQAGGCVKNFVL